MASLFRLYQQDAEARDPARTPAVTSAANWVEEARDHLSRLHAQFDQADDVSIKHKRIAADCLDLAIQSLRTGASRQGVPETHIASRSVSDSDPNIRPFVTTMLLMFVLLLVNLWVMSVVGVFSLFVLLAAAVLLHWEDIGVLERRLRSGRSKRAARKRSPTDSDLRTITTSAYVESVVRRIDEIIERDTPRNEAVSPPSLKVETLAFFQDILEAKIADDRDYAFKKISRTVVQVLSSEGIEVMTDAQNHAAMFTIDTITDPSKAGTVETVRPALVKQSQCIMTGYAQQFIDA